MTTSDGTAHVQAASKRLSRLLVLSFAGTILSFVASTSVAEYRAHGIEADAESIRDTAIPSVDHLARARTELRQLEVAVGDLAYGPAQGRPAAGVRAVHEARAAMEREWDLYRALPAYPGEEDLWDVVQARMRELDAAVGDVVASVGQREVAPASAVVTRAKGMVNAVDGGLLQCQDRNAREAARLGARIAAFRRSAHAWAIVLDALSFVFAAATAVFVVRVVRRFARVMEVRVSELERFAGRVAHDIRSPLTSVGLALDRSRRDPEIKPALRAMLDRGAGSLQRVGQIVDGLLLFARAGAPPSGSDRAELRPVIAGVVAEMRAIAEDKGITIEEPPDIPDVTVACTPGVLVSILANLVGNAVKYMGESPEKLISIDVRANARLVRVAVADTGPGVPEELRDRVFDPYVRAAGSPVQGFGLGLATVRRLAEAHGGRVGLEPGPGTGSVFWFELPCGTPMADAAHGPSGQALDAARLLPSSRRPARSS